MDYEASGSKLTVRLVRDFNILTARRIEELAENASDISIDLSNSRFVDSEAVALLCKLVSGGKNLKLRNPPEILHEVVGILGVESVLNLDRIVERDPPG